MSKKTYTVIYFPTQWSCKIAIDEEFLTPFIDQGKTIPENTAWYIKEMVNFWSGAKRRLAANDGDYIKTFLQSLAREINYIQAEYNYNSEGVREEFDDRDGWCKMDGSYGIEIVEIDDFDMEFDDYIVAEEELVKA